MIANANPPDTVGSEVRITTDPQLHVSNRLTLRYEIDKAVDGGARRIVIDLRHCKSIDGAAIGVLIGARRRLLDAGSVSLVLDNVPPSIALMFEALRIDRLFEMRVQS